MPVGVREQQRGRTRDAILTAAWELARDEGIAQLSLRDLAARVGMRAPSLYTHFDSKAAIYDAMFAQANRELQRETQGWDLAEDDAAEALTTVLERWLAFCMADLARYQLLYTRVVPGWEPSAEAYATAVETYEGFRDAMARAGVTEQRDLDLWTAIASGLASQQLANEPLTERWAGLARDTAEMFLAHVARRAATDRPQGDET